MGGASPASRTAPFQNALALVTIDGILHARRTFGDAAEPVRLHQWEIEILITLGSRAATDGCGLGRGCRETEISSTVLRCLVIMTLKRDREDYISEVRCSEVDLGIR